MAARYPNAKNVKILTEKDGLIKAHSQWKWDTLAQPPKARLRSCASSPAQTCFHQPALERVECARGVHSGTAGWWISLAYAIRRSEGVEKAEAILLRARAIHSKVAMIAFNLAC